MILILATISLHQYPVMSADVDCSWEHSVLPYYPCSYLIFHSPSFRTCSYLINSSIIDHCVHREMLFFWHFPVGNLTLTFDWDKKKFFTMHLFTSLLSRNPLIRNIFRVTRNNTFEEQLPFQSSHQQIKLDCHASLPCSIKIQTSSTIISDYGIYLRLMVNDNKMKQIE